MSRAAYRSTEDQISVANNAQSPGGNVLLLEFNELTPALLERFIAAGKLPNFAALHQSSQVFVTDAEEESPNLEPWIQWVTVHSGLSFQEHGVFHLGDGPKLDKKQIWDVASDAGKKVWICSSMNTRYDEPINGFMLPDPWTTGARPYPPGAFEAFVDFVRHNVQEHTNTSAKLSTPAYLAFLRFMVNHGFSVKTAGAIIAQLANERLSGKGRWRRAVLLDKLQWDLFKHIYKRERPALATMFLNSTAHFQHMYWRNMEPGRFKVRPDDNEQAEYEEAILFGYTEMDRIVGEALSLVGEQGTLILCSALGQQACVTYEAQGGKVFYRPHDIEKMIRWAGVEGDCEVEPVMSEQFYLRFKSEAAAQSAAQTLAMLRVDGKPALLVEIEGASLFAGCSIFDAVSDDAMIERGHNREPRAFSELFYRAEGMKSGMHHPDGILWIRRPGIPPKLHQQKVSLRTVAPTVLTCLGVRPPDYMSGGVLSSVVDEVTVSERNKLTA